jgi:hypothetical protein
MDISDLEDDIQLSLNVGYKQLSEAAARQKGPKKKTLAKLRLKFGEVFLSFGLRESVLSSNNIKRKISNDICCIFVPSFISLQVNVNDRRPLSKGGGRGHVG